MKKILSALVALCLVCLSFAATAEVVMADGSPLKLDGFTLNLSADAGYQLGEKAVGQVYVTVFPGLGKADASNFTVIWAGTPGPVTVEDVRMGIPGLKEKVNEGLKALGFTIDSAEYSEPAEASLAGEACVIFDSVTTISADGAASEVFQRYFYVGGKGFIFTAGSSDTASLDTVSALLDAMIAWD